MAFTPATPPASHPAASPFVSSANSPITTGTFKGLTSQQMTNYFNSLSGPSASAVQASQAAHDTTLLSGARAGQSNIPLRAQGGNTAASGQVNTLNYTPQQSAVLGDVTRSNWYTEDALQSGFDKAIDLATAAGVGAIFGPEAAAGIGAGTGTIAAGAITGATAGTAGAALTGQNIGKGALIGAVGGGLTAGANNLGASQAISDNTGLGQGASNLLVKQGVGAAVGAANNAMTPAPSYSSNNSNINNGVNAGIGAIGAAGSIANGGNNMAVTNTGNVGSGLGLGSTLLGTAGGILGTIGATQQANANGNVLSEASAGTGIGTNTSFNGPNSNATIANGQVHTALNGGLSAANTGSSNLAGQQSAIAGSFNGVTPANIQNAINSQSQQQAPTGTQGVLGSQLGLQGAVQGSQFNTIQAGTNQLNNPLTGNLQQAAQTQLGTAGQSFTNTYNNQLSALNQQLALPTQQAEAEMANQQFGRGQLGTSGGALQTQAFATGLGQAYLGNQQTAYNEALNAQNSATSNAATLNNSANNNLSTANGLLANAYGQFNNTSQLNANTANSIFNQNSTISQLGNQYGQQNLNNQITGAAVPAQLAGAYQQNANAGLAGATAANNIDLSGFQAALGAGTQQGNQYNNAIRNAAGVVSSGQTTNGLSAIGNALGNPALGSSIGGAFNALTGAGGQSTNAYNAANGVPAGTDVTGGINYSNPDLTSIYNSDFQGLSAEQIPMY